MIRKKLDIPADWNDAADNRNPAVQFDDKIAPIVPAAFRGTIWYQPTDRKILPTRAASRSPPSAPWMEGAVP